MKNWLKENQFTILFLAVVIGVVFLNNYLSDSRYEKCVRTNNEELGRCRSGELDDYDCAVFENAEEICAMAQEAGEEIQIPWR